MESVAQRRQRRVRFDTEVRLRRAGEETWIAARGVDLGEGGLGVAVRVGWPVGCALECAVEIDSRPVELQGVVAWSGAKAERPPTQTQVRLGEDLLEARPGQAGQEARAGQAGQEARAVQAGQEARAGQAGQEARPGQAASEARPESRARPGRGMGSGMGIAFTAPADATRSQLREAISQRRPLSDRVVLDFPGVVEPVIARAVPSERGLSLRAALPILREGTLVSVHYGRDELESRAVVARAVIDRESSVPVLRVDLEDADRAATVKLAARAAAEDASEQQDGAPGAEARANIWTVAVVVGLLGLVIGLGLGRTWAPPLEDASAVASASAQQPGDSPAGVSRVAGATGTADAIGIAASDGAGQDGPAAQTAQTAQDAAEDGPAVGAPDSTGPVGPDAVEQDGPEDGAEIRRGAGDAMPVVELVGHVTRVRVPIEGSQEGMRIYQLTSPGVAVNLPGARTPLRMDKYGMHQGLVRRVWLREEEGVLQVRVIFVHENVKHAVHVEGGELVVEVRR